jgi:hypothetical protein
VAVQFSIDAPEAVRVVPAASSVRKEALPVHLEHGVPCTPLAARQVEAPQAPVPALDSGPAAPADVLALARVPVAQVAPDSCRLLARLRVRSDPARMHAEAVSNIRRPKKAR